jgi:hypothetical protein
LCDRFRQQVREAGAKPAIPSKCDEAPARCPDCIYTDRNIVERRWARLRARLREWRAIATRYETTATSFSGILCRAAARDHLR